MRKPMTGQDAIRRIRDHFAVHAKHDPTPTPFLDEAVMISINAINDMERVNSLGGIEAFECALDIVKLLNADAIKLVCAENRAYKKLGTVEEIEQLLSHIQNLHDKLIQYTCAGTVSDVQSAVAKTKPHKIIVGSDKYSGYCPCCGNRLSTTFMDSNYCHWCGNKLTEFDEETEDTFEQQTRKISEDNNISIHQARCFAVNYTQNHDSLCQRFCKHTDECQKIHETKEGIEDGKH